MRSAKQAAAPALAIFTPSGGGTSEGFSPTIVYKYLRPGEQTDRQTETRARESGSKSYTPAGPVIAFYEARADGIKKTPLYSQFKGSL